METLHFLTSHLWYRPFTVWSEVSSPTTPAFHAFWGGGDPLAQTRSKRKVMTFWPWNLIPGCFKHHWLGRWRCCLDALWHWHYVLSHGTAAMLQESLRFLDFRKRKKKSSYHAMVSRSLFAKRTQLSSRFLGTRWARPFLQLSLLSETSFKLFFAMAPNSWHRAPIWN